MAGAVRVGGRSFYPEDVLRMSDVQYRIVLEHRLTTIETKLLILSYIGAAGIALLSAGFGWLVMHVP